LERVDNVFPDMADFVHPDKFSSNLDLRNFLRVSSQGSGEGGRQNFLYAAPNSLLCCPFLGSTQSTKTNSAPEVLLLRTNSRECHFSVCHPKTATMSVSNGHQK
jgi:hypothetical protein